MSTDPDRVLEIVKQFLEVANKEVDGDLTNETALYAGGLELDSLEAAELSALLEDELGTDPFSNEETMPETIGDILAFYEVASGT